MRVTWLSLCREPDWMIVSILRRAHGVLLELCAVRPSRFRLNQFQIGMDCGS